ncbi:DUF1223 domain-containing protein [Psychroserpens sp. MEBiC05023]
MKHILLTLFMIPLLFSSETLDGFPPVTVLELYTSQGCSSCPPADRLLTQIETTNQASNIIALSYHVDYWNYIGWKDPFSKSEFSNKQRRYSQKFNSSSVYTPQVVVNGKTHFVGSNPSKMKSQLDKHSKIPAENRVDLTAIATENGEIFFDYNVQGRIINKSIRIALVIEERITKISRGENRNRTLKNSNIVVSETILKLKSEKGSFSLTIPKLVEPEDELKLVVLIQNTDLEIVGGSQVNL